MKTIAYVTSNNGKFLEVQRYLQRHAPDINLIRANVDIEEMQSMDQHAIALDKAQKAWDQLKTPLLIDDAGIYFNRWHEFWKSIFAHVRYCFWPCRISHNWPFFRFGY